MNQETKIHAKVRSVPNPIPTDIFWNYRKREPSDLNVLKAARAAFFWLGPKRISNLSLARRAIGWIDRAPREILTHTGKWGQATKTTYGTGLLQQMSEQWHMYRRTGFTPTDYYAACVTQYPQQLRDSLVSYSLYSGGLDFCNHNVNEKVPGNALNSKIEFHDALCTAGFNTPAIFEIVEPNQPVDASIAERIQSSFFLKPDDLSQGAGAERWLMDGDVFHLKSRGESLNRADLPAYFQKVAQHFNRRLLVQELAENHAIVRAWAGPALSTIRIDTVMPTGQPPRVVRAMYRVPSGIDASVDNVHGGGVGYDVETSTGQFLEGLDDKTTVPDNRHLQSPVTGSQVTGESFPRWQEACSFAEKLHATLVDCYSVGWDIALTPDGLTAIEVNVPPGLSPHNQLRIGGFLGHDLCNSLVQEITLQMPKKLPENSRFMIGADL